MANINLGNPVTTASVVTEDYEHAFAKDGYSLQGSGGAVTGFATLEKIVAADVLAAIQAPAGAKIISLSIANDSAGVVPVVLRNETSGTVSETEIDATGSRSYDLGADQSFELDVKNMQDGVSLTNRLVIAVKISV